MTIISHDSFICEKTRDLGFSYYVYSQDIPIERMDSNKAPRKALQKPSTSIPGTRYATNINSKALITSINSPSVRILIGSVKKTKIGFINILTKAITTEAIKAVIKLETVIPGITQPTNIMTKDNANHFTNNIIVKTPYSYIIKRFYKKTL